MFVFNLIKPFVSHSLGVRRYVPNYFFVSNLEIVSKKVDFVKELINISVHKERKKAGYFFASSEFRGLHFSN